MMKWKIAALALFLSACSSQAPVSYYQLPSAGGASVQASSVNPQKQLWIENVTVADFLSGTGIAYQTSDVTYTVASSNLWASGLEQQLKGTLANNLSAQLGDWLVVNQPIGNSDIDTLRMTVNAFQGRYDGHAIVSGYWVLQHKGQIVRRPFDVELPLQKDGYSELVKVLAQAWQQEAVEIAKVIKNQTVN